MSEAASAGGAAAGERIGYLGLGSNVGDRRAQLRAAVDALPRHGVRVLASSSTYETEPVGEIIDQPDFLNACLRIATTHGPAELLDACKAVERELGREHGPHVRRHAPRPIDVDVLLLGELDFASERLRLPHPEVTSRRFVLVPLLELDPRLATPDGRLLADALARLDPVVRVVRAGDPLV
jgi:2-amino-4-hydroxy-6-hydroxymethyldihydropteridine diphosphokinase